MKQQPELLGRAGAEWLIRIPAGAWGLIESVRSLRGRSWNPREKLWWAPDSPALRSFLTAYGLLDNNRNRWDHLPAPLIQPFANG